MSQIVFSLDTELIWGFHDHDGLPTERIKAGRPAWTSLLELFDAHQIPVTWAIVGHLFLDSCDGVHDDHPVSSNWFARDPGSSVEESPDWHAPELIRAIQESNIDHEIASHSFSHIEFGDRSTDQDTARFELEQAIAAAKAFDVEFESFVFPRNNIGHRNLLAEYGFTCYRGLQPDRWFDDRRFRSIGKGFTFALGTSAPPIVTPHLDEHDLVNIPASLHLFEFEGLPGRMAETVTTHPITKQVKLGLEALRDHDEGVLHLWLHPNSLVTERDHARIEDIVSMVAQYRDTYDFEVATMRSIAKEVRAQ